MACRLVFAPVLSCLAACGATSDSALQDPVREGEARSERSQEPEIDFGAAARPAQLAGLRWLVDHQDADGKWDADGFDEHDGDQRSRGHDVGHGVAVHDVGVTGLAVLALLANGETPSVGPNRDSVARAVDWLVSQQDHESGLLGSKSHHAFIYDHAIATLALVETYGLTEDERFLAPAQRAVDYLEIHRNPYAVWRYEPRGGDNDTSVTGWCALVLCAARDFGLEANADALDFTLSWLDQVTDPATARTGYTERGGRSSRPAGDASERFPTTGGECMTAISLTVRALAARPRHETDVAREAQARLLLETPPSVRLEQRDFCYWLWGSMAMFQMGDGWWKRWSDALAEPILSTQIQDGVAAGSWDPVDPWGREGGRVYSTAMATWTLATPVARARVLR